MKKDKSIINFLRLINNQFGRNTFFLVDHWNIRDAIGLQKDNKLIFVEYFRLNQFFYECELLVDDPEIVYISQGSDITSKEQLLEIMSKFFEIKFADKKYKKDL